MTELSYQQRRGEIETYFDRTAVQAWAALTSDAPVGRIRATVRAGRDQMRATLLSWLPQDLRGRRILDAGCGTGMLAIEAARRGAHVVAIDLSPNLIELAQQRSAGHLGSGTVEFLCGDMLDPATGQFDHIVAMDSLIHYGMQDVCTVLSTFTARARFSVLTTFAPRTPALALMHFAGRFFPKSDRAPAIVPLAEESLKQSIATDSVFRGWDFARSHRITSGFYKSQALELVKQ